MARTSKQNFNSNADVAKDGRPKGAFSSTSFLVFAIAYILISISNGMTGSAKHAYALILIDN